MTNQPEPDEQQISKENRYMWIAVAVIVLIIAGGMGINMMIHHENSPDTIETSAPQK
jgi:hypothetical protein